MGALLLCGVPRAHGQAPRRDSARVASPGDTTRHRGGVDSLAQRLRERLAGTDLNIEFRTRLEAKAQQTRNERCATSVLFRAGFTCRAPFTPGIDAQFSLKTTGGLSDRARLDVDYDSQREFDGSNAILLAWQGRPNAVLRRLEVGNVTFTPPPSRFLTSGIPSGNFGIQTEARFGPVSVTAIAAQQKGNVTRDQVFNVGAGTVRTEQREIEDYQVEPRRFFLTVDPEVLGSAYPNLDIIDGPAMLRLAASLPDTLRPARVAVYRLILGGQPPNPNGPRFRLLGDPLSRAGQVYELLRENIDYYLDPSQLWLALVRPLALNNERLVVAYSFRVAGRDTVLAHLGGTPDLEFVPGRDQAAHLLWDPQVTPASPAFSREIRSVYRLGGDDLRRQTVQLRIVAGTSAEQEKPAGGTASTYLQFFGLAQVNNPSTFDAENRLWPRPNDPNFVVAATPGARLFRDQFVVFPSLQPFGRRGLARPAEVVPNDTIYRTPSEYLYSAQHPQSFYRLIAQYDVSGGSAGTIALNAVQIRPGSERLSMEGRPLVRGIDYEIDYELGRVSLLRPDTLSRQVRRVVVRYEENPLFATVPTSILGISSSWHFAAGQLSFTTISQSQRTTFNRPPLGFEPQSNVVSGLSGRAGWSLPWLARWFARRGDDSSASPPPVRLDVTAEVAMSRPRQRGSQQAYIESFEGEGGASVNLSDAQWQLSSQPSLGRALRARLGAATLDTARATTMAWQNAGVGADGRPIQFTIRDIDPQAALAGTGVTGNESLLWMTLYPIAVGGRYDRGRGTYQWQTGVRRAGRRWRSIRTTFGIAGSGIDLSRAEQVEFWTLVDTSAARRARNPTLVLDFGDISENAVAFTPDTLIIRGADSSYAGRHIEGWNLLDSERDPFSRAFNADVNDLGLAGDVASLLHVVGGVSPLATRVPLCALRQVRERVLGDAQANCTVRNGRLDEEDIDQDNALNFTSADRESERVRRFVVDLSDRRTYSRVGSCGVVVRDVNAAVPPDARLCWVQVRLPFGLPDDSTAGGPSLRRVRAMRVTMVSGTALGDAQFSLLPLGRLRVVGAPWQKRAERAIRGAAGTEAVLVGDVVATTIGTQDRDSTRGLFYESPPGVTDLPEDASGVFGGQQVQVNERSLRLLALGLEVGDRAEAFYRFPEGQRSFMGYRELRFWARGRGRGWGGGPTGRSDLQVFIKLGRDADNFYLFRTGAEAGTTRAAWEPEVRVNFNVFYTLRARVTTNFLRGDTTWVGCHGVDSLLIARSTLPTGFRARRYAACDGGHMVYTVDPVVTPPNLAAIQEVAVGLVRVGNGTGSGALLPGDTAEVWVDDIRLASLVDDPGYAGELAATLTAGDHGSLRVAARRRDPNFRQLGDAPSFLTNDDLEVAATWRLDRLLPRSAGLAIPLTILHRASGTDPTFLTRSDVRGGAVDGLRTPRARQTTVGLNVRRTQDTGPWYLALLDHAVLDGTASLLGSRSEFQDASLRDLNVGLDVSSAGFLSGAAPTGQATWWRPSTVRVSTAMVTSDDRRASFLKPAGATDDPRTEARGEQRLLRSTTGLEWRFLPGVAARWDASTVNDLRSYGGSSPSAVAARRERGGLLGLDLGLERERSMTTSLTVAPAWRAWVRPRASLGSTYAMVRDPNNRSVILDSAVADQPVPSLARRTGNTQFVTVATTIDPAAAALARWGEASRWTRLVRIIQPADLSVTRNQLAAYDGIPLAPGPAFQFGVGGIDAFRRIGGIFAANAGASTDAVLTGAIALPGGLSLTHRSQRTASRHWNRRSADRATPIDGDLRVLPDLALRWNGSPIALQRLFSSLGFSARALVSTQRWTMPRDLESTPEVRTAEQQSFPVSATAVTAWGDLTFSGTWALSRRVDSLPGSLTRGRASDFVADVSRSVGLPRRWGIAAPMRARASYQSTLAESDVSNVAVFAQRSRLTDNGRRTVNLNLDTDVSETTTFSLQAARVLTFDRNFDRRISQTLVSAVFQMQFFAGGGSAPR